MHKIRTISIKGITWRYLSIVLLLALAGILFVTVVGSYTSREAVLRYEIFERDTLSKDLVDLMAFYRNLVFATAQRQDVVDMLRLGDEERAVMWGKALRSILPGSIGVAMISQEGELLGDPDELNLGKRCVRDLKLVLAGKPVSTTPIHREISGRHHFDMVAPVASAGEPLGLLFMSFSLEVVQRRIEQRIGGKQYLKVEDSAGNILAEAGVRDGRGHSHPEPLVTSVPGTDWRMYYLGQGWTGTNLIVMAISVGGVIFIVTLTLALFLSARLVRFFNEDLNRIRGLLDGVQAGEVKGIESGKVRLKETSAIIEDVAVLVRNIEVANAQLKKESMHDPLTGLLNRRAFDEALFHYVGLAARGVSSRLVMLDLDLFKQVNDRYGHVVGDEVLVALAETLFERCRTADILARMGGDEFALIMPGDAAGNIGEWFNDVEQLFTQRQSRLNAGKGIEPKCHISAGSIVIDKGTAGDVKALLQLVDQKLYEAKHTGRASICY